MTLTLHYTGQLAHVLGLSRETVELEPGMSLGALVQGILERHGPEAAIFFRDGRGGLPATLLVAFDGVQADGDRERLDVSGVRDVMFMSPIAGG